MAGVLPWCHVFRECVLPCILSSDLVTNYFLLMALVVKRERPMASVVAYDPRGGSRRRETRVGTVVSVPRAVASKISYYPPRGVSRGYSARRSLPVETKYFDTSFSQTVSVAADWTGSEVPCTNYIQSDGTTVGAYTDSALIPSAVGAGYGQIVGSRYLLKKLRCRGSILATVGVDQADVTVGGVVRVCLVMDTQPNGAQGQGEEVFTDMGTATQNNYSYLAMGAGGHGKYRVLKDELVIMGPAVAGTDGASTNSVRCSPQMFEFTYAPSKPMQIAIKANSATPTVASLTDVNIFLLAHADGQWTPGLTIAGCARAYYCE